MVIQVVLALGGHDVPKHLLRDSKDALFLTYDEAMQKPSTNEDDEYSSAGIKDPKALITTSRDPSSRLQQFAKELRLIFPNAQRINRGNHVLSEIVQACRSNDVTDLIIVHEHRGVPNGLVVSHFPHGPTAYFSLANVSLRHDQGGQKEHVSEVYPHLIFNGFASQLGQRVHCLLSL